MTKAQRKLITTAINNDCQIGQRYRDAKGRTCAIAALVLAVRTKRSKEWQVLIKHNRKRINTKELNPVSDLLRKELDLTVKQLSQIQLENDFNGTPEARRSNILNLLKFW